MSLVTRTCQNICEIDSQYPTQTNTSSCDCGYYTGKVNNCFFNFADIKGTIPAGSKIDSATIKAAQISGGYSQQQNIYITVRSGAWYTMTWNNQAADAGAGTKSVNLSGSGAGTRSFDVTALIQWIIDNTSTASILKFARNPNTTTGSLDAKRFSPTPGNHTLEINYTAPPTAPTIGTAARVSDTQATIGWTNNATAEAPYASLQILRSTDGGTYTQIASIAGTSTSYTDTTTAANHSYAYKVRATNSAGTATSAASNVIYMTPAAPTIGTATKTGASEVTLTWTDNSNTEQYFEVGRTNDGGSNWTVLSATVAAGVESYVDTSLPSGTVAYRVRALRGTLYSGYSATSNEVTTTAPPAAPTLAAWPTYSPTGTTLRISWQHNTLDGSAQSKADVTYNIGAGDVTVQVTGTTSYYDINITGRPATQVCTAKVRTYGLHVDPGPYSALNSTTLADNPACNITTPAADGTVVTDAPLVVAWSYTDEYAQAGWTLRLFRGGVLSKTWTGTTQTSKSIAVTDLPNGYSYSLSLEVRSGSGFTGTATRTFSTDYTGPTAPDLQATWDQDSLSVDLVGNAGETGALPATDHLVLVRLETFKGVEEETTLEDPLPENSVLTDYVPRLDLTITYRLLAVAANGAYTAVDVEVTTLSNGACAVNFGNGYAELVVLQWDVKVGRGRQDDSETFSFAGRDLPVTYAGEHTEETLGVTALILDDTNADALDDLGDWRRVCTYRQPGGRRIHVKVTNIGEALGESPGTTGATVSLLRVE